MPTFRTTAAYISGGICGHTWMPDAMAGKPYTANLRGIFGIMPEDQEDPNSFSRALHRALMNEGGDFQDPRFTADTVIHVERRANDGTGRYRVHVRELELATLPDCADLVNADHFVADFLGDCE